MASYYGRSFDDVLRVLRTDCPVKVPVRVVTSDLAKAKMCGCCLAYFDDDGVIYRFVIKVSRDLSLSTAIDTLLHEWAHAMDGELYGIPTEPHRASWGKCYAKAWKAYANNVTKA